MEGKKLNTMKPSVPLITLPQVTFQRPVMFYGPFQKPNEIHQNIEIPNPNKGMQPKNPIATDFQIESILAFKLNPQNGQKLYLVKYKGKSFHDTRWIYETDFGKNADIIEDYSKKNPVESKEPYFNNRYLIPEKVISVKKHKYLKQYLVKWTDLNYSQSTWENEDHFIEINKIYNPQHNLIEEYEKRVKVTPKEVLSLTNSPYFHPILEFHVSKTGKKLNSLQIDILNFLLNSWCLSQNTLIPEIEDNEIRLGVVTFLEKIINQTKGNFLIITSQTLIDKWVSDISEWTNISFLPFIGNKEDLDVLKKYEFSKPDSTSDDFIYSIYITTYESLTICHKPFGLTFWDGIIIDNSLDEKPFDKASLNFISNKIKMKYRVFIMPPLSKIDSHDVWPWLSFVYPNSFHLESRFKKSFCKDGKIELEKLNSCYFSLFENANSSNFELNEVFIKCPLTNIQEDTLKSIYSPLLKGTLSNQNYIQLGYNLKQIGLTVRKLLNHPFCIKDTLNRVKQEKKKTILPNTYSITDTDFFMKTSGKLFVLDMLLKKLKSESKNVVIICQTSDAIEILEKYMLAKLYSYEKVDLYTRGRSRFDAVSQFNDESRRIFAFILDTKTGYFSMKADYVIIYESDWNPNNDVFFANKILASKNDKKIYRLITEKTYECYFMNENIKTDDLNSEKPISFETEMIGKLVNFGLEEIQTNRLANENADLNQIISSEQPDIESYLQKYTFTKKYTSVEELSNHITIEKWKQIYAKSPERNNETLDKKNQENEKAVSVVSKNLLDENDEDVGIVNEEEYEIESEVPTEEEEFNENDFNEDEMKPDIKGWTPKYIFQLLNLMIKFGVTSWDQFSHIIPFSKDEILRVSLLLIHGLLLHSENRENYIILQKYISRYQNKFDFLGTEMSKKSFFDNEFTRHHSKSLKKIFSPNPDWKLNLIEFLYIVDVSYEARKKSKGQPTIPIHRQTTLENDSKIMEAVKKKGFPITKFPSILKGIKLSLKRINDRALTLVEEIKEIFLDYCQTFEHSEEMTPQKLIDSLKMLSLKEKKKVFQAIQICGIDNMKTVFEASKLKRDRYHIFVKYIEQFKKFAHNIIRGKKVPFDFFGVHYSLKFLTKFIFDVAILKFLRDTDETKDCSEKDKPIFEYLKENGFKNIKKQEIFIRRFREPMDQELINYLHSYFNDKKRSIFRNFFLGSEVDISSPSKNDLIFKNIPNDIGDNNADGEVDEKALRLSKMIESDFKKDMILTDENLASILPIKINDNTIITNIGKVVTDRPGFHCERYLYLDGFTSERFFASIKDPSTKEWYICRILDTGGDLPVFRIQPKDDPSTVFEGNVSSRPSIDLLKRITFMRNKSRHQSKNPTVSGPEFFGFASPKIRKIMEHLPGANECPKFRGIDTKIEDIDIQTKPKKVTKPSDETLARRSLDRKRNIIFIDDEEEEVEDFSEEDEDDNDNDEDENEDDNEEENENDDDDDDDVSVIRNQKKKGRVKGRIQTRARKISTKRSGRSNYDDEDEDDEINDDEDGDEDDNYDNDDDEKSLIQRVKERYRNAKVKKSKTKKRRKKNKIEKRYNLRKRTKRRNYNEYEEEEENYDNDDDDLESDSSNEEIDNKLSEESEDNFKSSPSKRKTKKNKDKKKEEVPDLSDSSDENNYYDFACKNIPDMFSDDKYDLGNKPMNKKNVLNSGVVFYFDKLAEKPQKDIENYFHGDSNMLYIDQNFLEEFLSKNPRFSHYFTNK